MSPTLYQLSHHGVVGAFERNRTYLSGKVGGAVCKVDYQTPKIAKCIHDGYMRLEVKKWGNGLALRLPKNHPDYGELRPGMEVEVRIGARFPKKPWEPVVEDMGPADLSENHREYTAKLLDRVPWYEEYDS